MLERLDEEECDSCHYPTNTERFDVQVGSPLLKEGVTEVKLCHLCANTFAGNHYQFPTHYEHGKIMVHINWVANYLLDVITNPK